MPRRPARLAAALAVAAVIASTLSGAVAGTGTETVDLDWDARPHAAVPEDRYAMAGGCYTVEFLDGRFIVRAGDGFAAGDAASAEPFSFQATGLGTYLLYGTAEDFLAASEGLLAEAVYGVTESLPGQIAGGVALEQTDAVADALAASAANTATGRGASVVAADAPSDVAEWTIDDAGGGLFSIVSTATGRALSVDGGGALTLVPADTDSGFRFALAEGCAAYPEIEINIDGPVQAGATSQQEVRGFMDAHLHMMAFEFLGGRARCGRPWHRFGVTSALVDCPDHQPGGEGAVLEQFLSGIGPHDTDGWPTFAGWPRHDSLTHEQVYYRWMERAWRGGLRLFVNLLVDNHALCEIYPFKRHTCNEMDGVRLQAERIHELQDYIDAQNGGPGEGWFRIVTDPFEARRVINEGRLAVVLGIEVSVPLDCGIALAVPLCDEQQMNERLDAVYDLGVRQMELVNKFDNAFSGVAGDAGATGLVVNQGNKRSTGRYWQMETCTEADGEAHDKRQMNLHDDTGAPEEFNGRDSLAGAIFSLFGSTGATQLYGPGPHCNVRALSDLGEKMIRGMAARGMIFDPDHMAARARTAAMDLIDDLGYSGVVSSHGWADDTIYPRVYEEGGFVAPYAGGSAGFVDKWRQHRQWFEDLEASLGEDLFFGFGYGADTNGFGSQGGPRGANAQNPVTYPFAGFGGTMIDQQRSGTRTYDINTDGVAHYGLYPDWLEDLRRQAGDQIIEDMARGAEAYLQVWERAIGIASDACRGDVADLTDEQVASVVPGMDARGVLEALGQPNERGATYRFCMTGGRTASVALSPGGTVTGVTVS